MKESIEQDDFDMDRYLEDMDYEATARFLRRNLGICLI